MKRFKSLVFIVRQTWVLPYFPLLLQFFEMAFFIFNLLFLTPFTTNAMLGPGPYTTTLLVPVSDREKKPLKKYGAL